MGPGTPAYLAALEALRANDPLRFEQVLGAVLAHRTTREFVNEYAAPLTTAVGDAWLAGELPIFAEHMFTGVLQAMLAPRGAVRRGVVENPLLLLATPAGERHTLGLAMLHAVLHEAGVPCLALNADLPLTELVSAAAAYRADVVVQSFSAAYPPQAIAPLLAHLRDKLPPAVAIWAGGSGLCDSICIPAGVTAMSSIDDAVAACADHARSRSTRRPPRRTH